MRDLLPTLLDHDPGLLAIIAHRWDVDLESLDKETAAETLAGTMLDPDHAAVEWSRLNDKERGTIQTLLAAPTHKMAEAQFSRLFGEIRQMGPGRRDREKPHLNPANVAEILFYRGLIAVAFDQGKAGVQPFVYVPRDLAAALPTHETGFKLSGDPADMVESYQEDEPTTIAPAKTSMVDDLTTLLAYLQIERVNSEKNALRQHIEQALATHWLGENDLTRIALLLALAGGLGLAVNEDGIFKPVPANARRWLEETRPRQVRALAESWRDSTLFNDLWHVPTLRPEETGWRNDPLLARQTVITFLEMVPPDDWWRIDELIGVVKAEEPDFQRPAGDYDSWYIRNAATNEYLRGFESWDQVDAAVLQFILTGPMHWLGLVDLAQNNTLCRLTVYGRALAGEGEWPNPQEDKAPAVIEADGTIRAPRQLSRYERFQLARITEWRQAGDPYVYRLTANSLQRATRQNIQPDTIQAFLRRVSQAEQLPDAINRLLDQWSKMGRADLWISRAVILRSNTPDALQVILDTPELRRYLGAVLGPTAVIVREGQEEDLAAALQQHGILVELT